MNVLEDVTKTSIELILKEPFYGHFFTGLIKEVSDRVDTASVRLQSLNNVKLQVNSDFWLSLNNPQRYGLIKHEILHVVLKHLTRLKDFEHHLLFNIAADLVVNQYITKEQLLEDDLVLERFWWIEEQYNIKLKKNQDVGYYYNILKRFLNFSKMQEVVLVPTSCNGMPSPISLKELFDPNSQANQRHFFWKEFASLSAAEQKVLEISIHEILKQTGQRLKAKGHHQWIGNMPAGLSEYLEELFKSFEPNVNWKRVLKLFATSSSKTYLKNTIRRPSKRYGTTPGIKVKRKHKLLIAIDTSGSVSMDDLKLFFGEIYHIWRQGAEIHVVECDTHIHKKYQYKGIPPKTICGRGGTSFEAPLKYANQELRPDAIVYFTDGFANPPATISRSPVLWLISHNGIEEASDIWKSLKGRKVKMKS